MLLLINGLPERHNQTKKNMTDREFAVHEALVRVHQFGQANSESFPPGSKATEDFVALATLKGQIKVDDFEPGNPRSPATGAKAALIAEVREVLEAIEDTAETIAETEPGFDANFILGDDTQRETISSAQAFLGHLGNASVAAKFIAYSMDATFVTDLQDDIDTITGKKTEQAEDLIDDVGETALTRDQIKQARKLIKSLNTSVRNKFRRNPELLAEWSTASRIRRAPRPPKTKPHHPNHLSSETRPPPGGEPGKRATPGNHGSSAPPRSSPTIGRSRQCRASNSSVASSSTKSAHNTAPAGRRDVAWVGGTIKRWGIRKLDIINNSLLSDSTSEVCSELTDRKIHVR